MPVEAPTRPSQRLPKKRVKDLEKIDSFIVQVTEYRQFLEDASRLLEQMNLGLKQGQKNILNEAIKFRAFLQQYIKKHKENPAQDFEVVASLLKQKFSSKNLLVIRSAVTSMHNKLHKDKRTKEQMEFLKLDAQAEVLLGACHATVEPGRLGAIYRAVRTRTNDLIKAYSVLSKKGIIDETYAANFLRVVDKIQNESKKVLYDLKNRNVPSTRELMAALTGLANVLPFARKKLASAA